MHSLTHLGYRLQSGSSSKENGGKGEPEEEGDSFKSENEKDGAFQNSNIMSVEDQQLVVNQTSQKINAEQPPLIVLVKNARSENNLNQMPSPGLER